ncbi:hypothetical protein AVBRAN12642_02130 [Campylobacter sp. RM12642]|uniref:NfeD family protein n=1 Tax=unclassified Campylobacter TaxID=2593542 RepID=UPI001BDA7D89|nr:hypothetical protein [Campylobacter sp. 2018MI01]MBT0879478.1 hypothetical protein [Campylobacter sp. 2018MI01]MBZ7979425.1 hypothetical protein [Campylobacter sp. RM12642]MBZ7983226.1 hypothetical protein [Campylobacter sp. RM12647]MBZ7992520.1 hypothetical protein [Campylobacter sp. RM9333]
MSSLYLLCIGIFLGILELLVGSFYIIFFAIGFIIVGAINLIKPLDLELQIILIAVISLVLLIIFKFFVKTKKVENYDDDFLNTQGEGVVKNGMIYYKGSFWQTTDNLTLREGEIVKIEKIHNNKVKIKQD